MDLIPGFFELPLLVQMAICAAYSFLVYLVMRCAAALGIRKNHALILGGVGVMAVFFLEENGIG